MRRSNLQLLLDAEHRLGIAVPAVAPTQGVQQLAAGLACLAQSVTVQHLEQSLLPGDTLSVCRNRSCSDGAQCSTLATASIFWVAALSLYMQQQPRTQAR